MLFMTRRSVSVCDLRLDRAWFDEQATYVGGMVDIDELLET